MGLAGFLVDLAAVLHASRSVASKHVALRARQIDQYGKASSILRAKQPRGPAESSAPPSREPTSQFDDGPAGQAPIYQNPEPSHPGQAEAPVEQLGSFLAHDGFPSMRIGGLKPRSSPLGPRPSAGSASSPVTRNRIPDQGTTRSEAGSPRTSGFVPAPWAGIGGSPVHQTSPTTSQDRGRPNDDKRTSQDGTTTTPAGIDIDIFRTTRGAKTLGPLKIPGQETLLNDKERTRASTVTAPSPGPKASTERPAREPPVEINRGLRRESPPRQSLDSLMESNAAHVVEPKLIKVSEATRIPDIATEKDMSPRGADFIQQEAINDPVKAQNQLSGEDAELVGDLAGLSQAPAYQLRESKVPATRISRLWNYGGLAASMFAGALGEGLSRAVGGGGEGSMMLSPGNMERLVAKLSRMRGAALKMGQMMSFQDEKMLPGPIQEVLQRVQDRADYMPSYQRDRVLVENLGSEWRDLFDKFEETPIAAASIGQVHRATLKSNGQEVAVKIQFPGVADSINSDLDNLGILLTATRLLPKGLYLNKTIENSRTELAWECDYEREAQCGQRYRELLSDETGVFLVPKIYPEGCGKHVLTMEYMEGTGVTRVKSFTQEQRDWIGTQILRLCLREITEFKFMQTDPNWTNFLYNAETNKLELLDFGASREYPDQFITLYVRLLEAASKLDRVAVKALSEELGYLTGHESKAMLDAHITSILTLAEPFLESAPEVYDFRDQTITERVKSQIPVMIRERLAPPPEETYSLHRKLSGAFLLCARLGSRVRCRDMFEQALKKADLTPK